MKEANKTTILIQNHYPDCFGSLHRQAHSQVLKFEAKYIFRGAGFLFLLYV